MDVYEQVKVVKAMIEDLLLSTQINGKQALCDAAILLTLAEAVYGLPTAPPPELVPAHQAYALFMLCRDACEVEG